MTSDRKGNQNETEAKNILARVFGSGGVEKVDAYSNHDPFHFVDIIAIHPKRKVLFVQSKTNRFTAEERRRYKAYLRRLPTDHAEFEVWTRIDRKGWKMERYNPDTEDFEVYIEMDTCNIEDTVRAVREAFDYWELTDGAERPDKRTD